MNKNGKRLLLIFTKLLFIFIVFYNVGSVVWQYKEQYFTNDFWQRYDGLKKVYEESQYVNKNPKGWVPDQPVNAYAGGAYVKGVSPILIAPDTPPLGRYLIGISALLFGNENVITIISGIVALVFMYLVGKQIFISDITALLAPTLLSFEPLFKIQFQYTPLLDIIQLDFLLACFWLFNKGLRSRRFLWYFVGVAVSLGCFIATKFFATGITIIAALALVLLLHKDKKRLIALVVTFPVSIGMLLLTYIQVFSMGYNLSQFLGIQKWVYLYHKSQLILPFSIWPLMLFNKWYTWWGNEPIISDPNWQLTWPLLLIGSIAVMCFYVLKKFGQIVEIEALMMWAVCYILFFSIGQVTSRYLVIYLPILYLVCLFGAERFIYRFIIKANERIKK
jgi:hypothetical protein